MPKKIALMQLAALLLLGGVGVLAQKAENTAAKPKVTLHDQAKKSGGKFIMRYKPSRGTIYPNIEELAKRSDLIVVGKILSHKANLTPDERSINQDFLVKVQELIKGDLPKGRSILLTLRGGTHRFPDKTFAAMMPIGYKQPEDGGLYLMFLKSKDKNSPFRGQRLVSEDQGLFALTGGSVEPADLVPDDPINSKYRKMSAPAFLREVHKAVPRKNKAEKKP